MVKRYNGVNKLKSSGGSLFNLSNLASAVQDRRHFPKAVVGIILSSTLVGYGLMTIIDKKREVRKVLSAVDDSFLSAAKRFTLAA
jgi:hypothetical protein